MRYASIDVLRTVAIVLMVVVHFMENLAGADWAPAGLGAPLFTFLVGLSYRLWLNSQEAKGVDETDVSKITIRRGLFLFALGFAFNVCVWLPNDAFNWDVLTLIGTALLVLNVVRNLPLPLPVFIGIVAFALGPVLRTMTDYPSYWTDGYFDPDFTPSDVLAGFLANGYFPLFPWLLYPLAGFVAGSLVFADPARPAPSVRPLALVGAALIVVAVAALWLAPASGHLSTRWTMFPASVVYVTGTLGGALLSFALMHRWVDRNPNIANGRFVRVCETFSKHSLSMYLLHHVVHLWPLWVYGAATGNDATHFWRNAIPVAVAIPLSVLCLVGCYFMFRWMDATGRRGIEGWMRRVCG